MTNFYSHNPKTARLITEYEVSANKLFLRYLPSSMNETPIEVLKRNS